MVIHARASREAAEQIATSVRARGGQSEVMLCDLADPANHAPLVERAWQWQGSIDIWVNNAGADVLTGEAADWSFQRKLQALWQ
ncbi:MAG: SDR family NAD(P)-dependent oxidoreductase, partial [Chloroflexi bacterium]|nr:SDR family NAD(P)-dependent oxidoreductase [Chloroflexota bacterium]